MAGVTRRTWLGTFGLAPLAYGAAAGATAQESPPGPRPELSPRERIRRHHLPSVQLITHEGRKVRFYEDLVKDKKVVINFMYVRCKGICLPVTHNLARVQQLLGDRVGRDIFFYSITLKPEEDTPDVLKHYAEIHHVGPGWLFLTGQPEDIEFLRKSLGYKYDDPVEDADKSNHIGMIRFGNEPAMRWAACPGQANPQHIVRSILWDLG